MQYQHHQNGPIPLLCYIDGCDGALMEKPTRWRVWIIERSHHEFNEEQQRQDCALRNRAWKAGSVMIKNESRMYHPCNSILSTLQWICRDAETIVKRSTRFSAFDDATFSRSFAIRGVKIVIALVALLHNGSKSHLSCQLCGSALWAQWVAPIEELRTRLSFWDVVKGAFQKSSK